MLRFSFFGQRRPLCWDYYVRFNLILNECLPVLPFLSGLSFHSVHQLFWLFYKEWYKSVERYPDILYLVHNGSVPLGTAIECIFTDCISSLIFADYLFFPALTPPWTNCPQTFHTSLSLPSVDWRLQYYMGYFTQHWRFFTNVYLSWISMFSLSHFLYNIKTWENIWVFFWKYITIDIAIKPQPSVALHTCM